MIGLSGDLPANAVRRVDPLRPTDRRRFIAMSGAALLAGCGPRGRFSVAAESVAAAGTQTLLVATTRAPDPAPIAYGTGRSGDLDFARLAVSIPPTHQAGTVEWPEREEVDPARHFALVGAEMLPDVDALTDAVQARIRGGGAETVLFVHGYNTNFAEGVYRHAQVAWDYGLQGPQIHFAWPSAARPLGYAYDRDSTLAARDALTNLLLRLLREPGLNLSVVGHSMGAFLVMEALRQIALQGEEEHLRALAGVTLISPDIDIDLFRAQAARLNPLPQPFVVAVAQNDRVLNLSSHLANGQARLGTLRDLSELKGLGIVVVDMTGLGTTGGNHFLPGTSPAAIALIRGLRDTEPPPRANLELGPVRLVLGARR